MGSYSFRTDSIGVQGKGYDFSSISSKPYKHDESKASIDYSRAYCFKTSGGSSNPIKGYAIPKANTEVLENCIASINASLANVKTLSSIKNDSKLSESSKAEIETILDSVKIIENDMKTYAKSELILKDLVNEAAALDTQAEGLYNACLKEIENATSSNPEATGDDKGKAQNESTIKVVEGDANLSNESIQKRYGINPVSQITQDINAASLASEACNAIDDSDDADSRAAFVKYFGDGAIPGMVTANNIIQVLNKISDMKEFIEDIQDQDVGDGEASIRQLMNLVSAHLDILVNAGALSKNDEIYKSVSDNLKNIGEGLTDFDEYQDEIANYFTQIQSKLISVGTQKYVDDKITAAQKKEETEAVKRFAKDFAELNKNSGISFEYNADSTYSLPEDVKYLPNKQVFNVKIEGKTFQGKDFKELNSKIMRNGDKSIILTWIDIKKEWASSNCEGSDVNETLEETSEDFDDDFWG